MVEVYAFTECKLKLAIIKGNHLLKLFILILPAGFEFQDSVSTVLALIGHIIDFKAIILSRVSDFVAFDIHWRNDNDWQKYCRQKNAYHDRSFCYLRFY